MQKRVKINSKRNKFVDEVTDLFVTLMLCTAKPPFRTNLTIFTKMNDFEFIKIADDLRQNAKATSLLGLVVMPGPEKCQLVKL